MKRQPVAVAGASLVRTGYLPEGPQAPLVIEPASDDTDWAAWAADRGEYLEAELLRHGALLFRGWGVRGAEGFEGFARCLEPDLFGEYGDLPREGAGGSIYKSTPYPAEQTILFHNESSHLHRWPRKIFFCCVKAATAGGETPIVDCREVYRLLDPEVRRRFEQKGLLYVRNYTAGLDVSWQSFFHTEDRAEVERHCRRASMEFEWKDGDGLRTRRAAQAVARHPKTGESVFFNQIQLHHVSCLEPSVRRSLLSVFRREDLPRDVLYGDGTPIEDDVVAHVLDVYRRAAVAFAWREGDVMMLDNMLTAHGRYPFAGQRKVLVAMGDLIGHEDLRP